MCVLAATLMRTLKPGLLSHEGLCTQHEPVPWIWCEDELEVISIFAAFKCL